MASTDPSKPGFVQRQVNKAQTQVQKDAHAVVGIASEAAQSGAYLYPLRGVYYFLRNPKLLVSIRSVVLRSVILSIGVLLGMFTFAYLPQVALFAIASGPLAFVLAVPAVLAESFFLITFLTRTLLLKGASERIFDAVLAQQGYADLVEKGRQVTTSRNGSVTLGRAILSPVTSKLSTEGLVRYFLSLPLNAIPGVGTFFFLGYNGRHAGPAAHSRYFQLKGFTTQQKREFVEQRQGAYTSFGAASLALGLVPIVSVLFTFTSAAGAALWAAEMEKTSRGSSKGVGGDADKKVVDVTIGHDEL